MTNQIIGVVDRQNWNASLSIVPSYRFSSSGRSLFAIGMIIGTVSRLEPRIPARDQELYDTDAYWDRDTGQDFFLDRLNFARSILEVDPNNTWTGEPKEATIAALYEVQFLSYRKDETMNELLPYPVLSEFCKELYHMTGIPSPFYVASILRYPNRMFGMVVSKEKSSSNSSQTSHTQDIPSVEKTIALGPLHTQIGDIVVALGGCRHPLLLRKEPEGYHVVGEACVAGFMHGEALLKYHVEEFELV